MASDHGLHCLLIRFSHRPNTPKMTNGLVQHVTVEESTSIPAERSYFNEAVLFGTRALDEKANLMIIWDNFLIPH